MNDFFKTLQVQRWDDHRFYHHNRINQSLHLVSATSFVVAYAWLLVDPVVSALIAWLVSMTTRQIGHFFFEPTGYDTVNQTTHAHKEDIKVGYNLRRKVVLMGLWALIPLVVWMDSASLGFLQPVITWGDFVRRVGAVWLWLGVAGLLFRAAQLLLTQNALTAIVWVSKILSDPFHDIWLYRKAPLYLMRGELMDPMTHVRHG